MTRLQNIRLRGDYAGHRDAAIHFKFRFCDDSVYYYLVEQLGIWRLAHRGRFEIRAGLKLRPYAPDKVIRLTPTMLDVVPRDQYAYRMLAERGLPARETEDYTLSGYQHEHAVNPNIMIATYNFGIPAADRISGREWSLAPVTL